MWAGEIERGDVIVLAPLLLFFAAPMMGADLPDPNSAPTAIMEQSQISATMPGDDSANFQTVVIEQQVMIRIPASRAQVNGFSNARSSRAGDTPVRVQWREVKAPRCIPMRSLMGVQYTQRSSIDLITRERQRLRAALDGECRAADFYSGFYMVTPKDGMVCANRDVLHARSGARCDVRKFSYLVPEPRDD